MLKFRDITIEDKEAMSRYLNLDKAFMTEREFISLFTWSDNYKLQICLTEDTMYLCSDYYADYFMFFPPFTTGDFKEKVLNIVDYSKTLHKPPKFNAVSQAQRELFEEHFGPEAFCFIENRNAFDYVYSAEDLMHLVGKKFSAKRNHINKFLSENDDNWQYEVMDPKKHFDEVMEFQLKWCREKGDSDCENLPETFAIKKALTHFDAMGLKGGILRVNGLLAGFTIGNPVYSNLFGVMFEKADMNVNGAYPVLNQQFALANFTGYEFVNREEDLGIEGLRKAKQSYQPISLTMKYIVEPRQVLMAVAAGEDA